MYEQAMDILDIVRAVAGSEQGRARFVAQYAELYARATDLFHQQDQDEAAFFTSERGRARAFLDSLATKHVELGDNEMATLLAKEQEAYSQRQTIHDALIRALALIPPDPDLVTELETRLAETETAHTKAQAEIQKRQDQLAGVMSNRTKNVLNVAEVQALLDADTTLVSYVILEDEILIFVLTRTDFHVITSPVSREELAHRVNFFRQAMADRQVEVIRPAAEELYGLLIAPVADRLHTPRLVIVPHGPLHHLPFAALINSGTGQPLIESYSLVNLPSASALTFIEQNAKRQKHPAIPALVLGNPITAGFDVTASLAVERGLSPLPFAEREARVVADLYGVEPLLGQAATEGAVLDRAAGAGVVHIAAHGAYNPMAPLSSLIALAPDDTTDGWLTVGEIYGLDLSQTDLVVLSACQTNLGELSAGDELVGLTRAFFFAGTPSVMATLWNVDDETTGLLMERFYTHLRAGMGKAAALRQAQLELIEDYPDPYYWAGFVLSGEG
jgi:CHAT domain-containing protein